jgi:hypothetical protein
MPDQPKHPADNVSVKIWLQCQEFKIPPIRDALVLGKNATIGCEAMRRALTLLHVEPFEHIDLSGDDEDDVVGDVLVRRSVLNKVPRGKLIRFLVGRVKPFMTVDEILHLRVDVEVCLEDQI